MNKICEYGLIVTRSMRKETGTYARIVYSCVQKVVGIAVTAHTKFLFVCQ